MDGPGIDQKIRFGYAKAAAKLGKDYLLYRSAVPINPIQPSNLIGTIKMVPTIDWKWMKSNRPGNAIWWLVVDGQDASLPLSATEGDYLVGDGLNDTYFVLTKEYQMPMSGAQCNRMLTVVRANQSIDKGDQGYGAYPASGTIPIMTNMPGSILKDRKGPAADSKLPTDMAQPEWIIQLPNLDDVDVLTGDFIMDDLGVEYVVSTNEETEFGWRLTARQVVNY